MANNQLSKGKVIKIVEVGQVTETHWRLLLLADPNKELVQNYLQSGSLFEVKEDHKLVAVMVLQKISLTQLEIKNIAVDSQFENQGIATDLLHIAVDYAKEHHYQQLIIGTGSTSFKQLYLYQKVGFRVTGIQPDFFVKNYHQPIYENGLRLRDMLVLMLNISD